MAQLHGPDRATVSHPRGYDVRMSGRVVAVGLGFALGLVGLLSSGAIRLDLLVGLALVVLLGAATVPIGGSHAVWALAGLLAGIAASLPASLVTGVFLFLGDGWQVALALALGAAVVGHAAARLADLAVRGASPASP